MYPLSSENRTCDAFVYGEQVQVQAVAMPGVEELEDVGQDGGVLAAGSSDGHLGTGPEHTRRHDGVMHLGLEGPEEAVFAQRVIRLGSLRGIITVGIEADVRPVNGGAP